MSAVQVNFDKSLGKSIKAVHGVNNGPLLSGNYLFSKYKEMGDMPYVRLHDSGGANSRFHVDISRIFENFNRSGLIPRRLASDH